MVAGRRVFRGESRGKIWRVRLVKTDHGYIGKEFLIAGFRCHLGSRDFPRGDLYVCCHSGQPDWGTGPNGEGKIFKISYTDPKAPQPVLTCASGPWKQGLHLINPSILRDKRGARRRQLNLANTCGLRIDSRSLSRHIKW